MEQFVRAGPHTTHPNGLAYGMSLSLVGFATFLVGRFVEGPQAVVTLMGLLCPKVEWFPMGGKWKGSLRAHKQ